MMVRLPFVPGLLACLCGLLEAQEPKSIGYPQKDALSPFRNPTDVYAPPDEVYRLLRVMQTIAEAPGALKKFDADGRETIADKRWQQARAELAHKGLDAGYLAQIMRLNRNAVDRATAFYGAFYCANVDHVFELIAHIPGEPERRTRELAMPRAIEFLRANLKRRFGDLSKEGQEALAAALPKPGSPEAKAKGLGRAPTAQDYLHSLTLVPFLQLLDVDTAIDQAQALWFLKETFAIRPDLALLWLEPSLPRVRQLLLSPAADVQQQAIGLVQAIGPKDLKAPPAEPEALLEWADLAAKSLFPPIRNLNDTIVQMHPSPERDALAQAARAAVATSAIGDPFTGERKDGTKYRGFRILTVPKELAALAIPPLAVVTTVNGVAVIDAKTLLATVTDQLQQLRHPRRLLVEYVFQGEPRAIEYRLL
jgi:hypothetical protein